MVVAGGIFFGVFIASSWYEVGEQHQGIALLPLKKKSTKKKTIVHVLSGFEKRLD